MNNKIVKNASWIIGAKIFQSIISFLIGMVTARYLGPSNYGLINYAASITAFVIPIMQLGITNVLVQELINNPDKEGRIIGSALLSNIVSSVLCIVGVFAFSLIATHDEKETIIVCLLYSILLIFQAFEVLNYWFQSKYLAKYSSTIALFVYAIVAIYKIFLLVTGKSVYWFAISNAIDYCLIAIISMAFYYKLGGQKLSFSFSEFKWLYSKGKYYIVSSLMVTIFAQTDKVMLNLMLGAEYTGYYSAAVTCASMTSFVFVAILDSYRPYVFENKKIGEEQFDDSIANLYAIIIYLSLIQCVGIALFSKWIILIIYGHNYYTAISALRIIVWYTTFAYLGSVRNIWLLAEDKQKYLWVINLSGACANVILNYVFIAYLGIIGASIASLITQIFTNVIIGYIIKPIQKNNKLMIKGLSIKRLLNVLSVLVKSFKQ